MKKTNLFIQTLCTVIAATMCFLFPSLQVSADSEFYNYSDSPRYFSVNAEVYQFTLLYSNGLSDYSWNTLETTSTYGVHVSKYTGTEEPFFVNTLENANLYTADEIQNVKNILAHISVSEEKYDFNSNGKVTLSDLVYGVQRYASIPTNFIYNDAGTLMELTNFIDLLNYNIEAGNTDFVVRYGDTVPVVTTTTTTPSSTTTTSTETTTQPTTTSTTSTTTSSSTTTTSTTTSSSTTTTSTTTSSSTTTTSTTTSSSITTTTTTSEPIVTTSFSAPAYEDLVDPYGYGTTEDEYNGMLATVDLFGLEYYKIVYSEELIPYSLILTSDTFAVSADICDFVCFQVCPIKDEEIINPGFNYQVTGCDFVIWRPNTMSPSESNYTEDYACVAEDLLDPHYWCIIPCTLDEETGELVENLTLLYPISE